MIKNILFVLTLFIILSCGPTEPEEELPDFLYPLHSSSFEVKAYREIGLSTFTGISGIQRYHFSEASVDVELVNYGDSSSSFCTGQYTASLTAAQESEVFAELSTNSGTYDIHSPYVTEESVEETNEEVNDVFRSYFSITVDLNTLTMNVDCGITVFTENIIHTSVYQNGDLILIDYARGLEFLLSAI